MMYIEKKRGPYFLKNNAFGTITISVIFPFKYQDKNYMKIPILLNILNRSNNYKEKSDFKKAKINNYIIALNQSYENVENTAYFRFNLTIPNPNRIPEVSLEKAIALLADYIYNPFLENNGFEEKEVQKYIDIYHKEIKEREELTVNYSYRRLLEISAPKTKLSNSLKNHEYLLDEITGQNLYKFYQTIIDSNPFVFSITPNLEQEITDLINKYIYKKKEETIKISKIRNHFLTSKEFQAITEEKDFFQSYLALVYKVKDMKNKDRYTLYAIDRLLSSQSSFILLKKMRLENDLVYTTGSYSYGRYGYIALTALINKTSKEKALKTLKEVTELLKDEKYISPLLENIKNEERIEMIKDKDRKGTIIRNFIANTLEWGDTDEQFYKKLCKVKPCDINELANRLVLDTEYFVRGNKDAK